MLKQRNESLYKHEKLYSIGFLPEDKTYFTDNRSLRRSVPPFYAEFFRLCFHSVIFGFFCLIKETDAEDTESAIEMVDV